MIDQANIERIIRKNLLAYLNKQIEGWNLAKPLSFRKQNQNIAELPPYPYGSYLVTTSKRPNQGTWGEQYIGDTTEYTKQIGQIWSINFFSDDEDQTDYLAKLAHEWFDLVGNEVMSENGFSVESITAITNRDNLLTVGYEYRQGFDVTLVVIDKVEIITPWIVKFEINKPN